MINPLNFLLFSWRDSCLSNGMKNLSKLVLSVSCALLLIGCGGIDSVPLPDNNPGEEAANAAENGDTAAPGDDVGTDAGDGSGGEDSGFTESSLESFVVSAASQRLLAPSRSIDSTQVLTLESADGSVQVIADVSSEGAANASLESLPDGLVSNLVDGLEVSAWTLDSSWLPNTRAQEAIDALLALAEDPFKRDGTFTWSQCGEASCLTVTDASLSGEVLVVGVFSQALERGVVKNIASELIQIPLPPNTEGADWKVVVGSSAQAPYVGRIVTLSPPLWE